MKFLGAVGLGLALLAICVSARQEDDARFVGVNSVWTNYDIKSTTLTAYVSCSSQINTAACAGGRRRRRSVPIEMADKSANEELHSALESAVKTEGTSSDKSEKLLFTFWSTTNVDTIVTYISTDTRTTVSISYACSVAPSDRVLYEPAC